VYVGISVSVSVSVQRCAGLETETEIGSEYQSQSLAMGHTPDISSLATFNFYEPVWYIDQTAEFPKPRRKLGRWLGEAYDIGQAMCY